MTTSSWLLQGRSCCLERPEADHPPLAPEPLRDAALLAAFEDVIGCLSSEWGEKKVVVQ